MKKCRQRDLFDLLLYVIEEDAVYDYLVGHQGDFDRMMLKQADVVICYVTHSTGGAAKYVQKAERQGKRVIHIASKI